MLVARGRLAPTDARVGKDQLVRIVSMLTKWIEKLYAREVEHEHEHEHEHDFEALAPSIRTGDGPAAPQHVS